MRSETVDRIIGSVLLIVGIAILIFVLTSAFSLATAPGDFFREQIPEEEQVEGPTSEFSWSSNNLDVTFTDESQEGSATISSWNWNFGDGGGSSDPNPSHPYTGDNQYEVTLEVQDENGKRSTARANVNVASGETKSGASQTDASGPDIDMGTLGLSLGVGILMTGLYMVMFLVGAAILKAGWNMMKPKPEKLNIKLKPKEITIKQVGGRVATTQEPAPPPQEVVPPPQEVAPPPPPEDVHQIEPPPTT